MKITLNSSIPEARRAQIEALVKIHAGASSIIWLPSRFPRYVMLVEPGEEGPPDAEAGSIFESPNKGARAVATVTAMLEEKIGECLAGPPGASPAGGGARGGK